MGRVPGNKGPDPHSLKLFDLEEPLQVQGVVEFAKDFKSNAYDSYPVWTENKSKLIAQYVYHFIMVTKHGAYIDGFAGPQVEEYNDESWSVKRVLEIRPPWIRKFILCDLDPRQVQRLNQLKLARADAGDDRVITVNQGDFNVLVDRVLADSGISEKEATFCLLDQRTFECNWSTVRKLAAHKTTSKIELFYFVAVGWLARSMAATRERKKLVDWWGRNDVEALQGARSVDIAQMFVQRFEQELGYKRALAWPIHDRGHEGRVMYYMIHATDHPEAPKLMNRAYWKSTHAAEPMEHLQQILDGFALDGSNVKPLAQ